MVKSHVQLTFLFLLFITSVNLTFYLCMTGTPPKPRRDILTSVLGTLTLRQHVIEIKKHR